MVKTTGLVVMLLLARFTPSSGITRAYHYVQLLKSWPEAQRYCRENFVDLATIEDMEDSASVKEIMTNKETLAFIGLYYDNTGWRWSIDETPLYKDDNTTLGDWFVFVEDNYSGADYCAKIQQETLHDHSCDTLRKSVCYDESTNKYIPVTDPMDWWSAQMYCRETYTDLASMRTPQEKEEIMKLTDDSYWWIGLSRNVWRWSDKSKSLLKVWTPGEPQDPEVEPCAAAGASGWGDVTCHRLLPFICSVPMMKLIKVVLKADGSVDMNDPLVQKAVLKHIERQMKDMRWRWREQQNGKIFSKT